MISKKGSKAVSALVIALLVFQNGCGTVSREQMIEYNNKYKLPYKPRKDLALIYVVRSNALFAYNLSLNVFIDESPRRSGPRPLPQSIRHPPSPLTQALTPPAAAECCDSRYSTAHPHQRVKYWWDGPRCR